MISFFSYECVVVGVSIALKSTWKNVDFWILISVECAAWFVVLWELVFYVSMFMIFSLFILVFIGVLFYLFIARDLNFGVRVCLHFIWWRNREFSSFECDLCQLNKLWSHINSYKSINLNRSIPRNKRLKHRFGETKTEKKTTEWAIK